MASKELFGLPKININFKTQASSALIRSSRGVVVEILNDENIVDDYVYYNLTETSDIPTEGISEKSVDLIKKTFTGTPARVHVFLIPEKSREVVKDVDFEVEVETETEIVSETTVATEVEVESTTTIETETIVTDPDTGESSTVATMTTVTETVTVPTTTTVTETVTVQTTTTVIETRTVTETELATVTQSTALRDIADLKFNYICHPTGDSNDQESLSMWVKGQRANKSKTFKAVVANVDGDSYSVINFTTGKIRTANPDYQDALAAADGDAGAVDASIPQYLTYTAAEYTGRIAGILAGISLDRSATYYELPEVVDCAKYDDIDENINKGELCLFDEKDGNGVKIARACNSLHTFSAAVGEDFRYIKIVEGLDLIRDDISSNFRNNYVGKVPNTYENKMLFIAAITVYLEGLKGTVLDNSDSVSNYVEIDPDAHIQYAKAHNVDINEKNEQEILELPTGTHVYLRGRLAPVNAMEDLDVVFYF